LIEHRDAILLAEIGVLIHDLGKLSEEFTKKLSQENNEQYYVHSYILGRSINLLSNSDKLKLSSGQSIYVHQLQQINLLIGDVTAKELKKALDSLGLSFSKKDRQEIVSLLRRYRNEIQTYNVVAISKEICEVLNNIYMSIFGEKINVSDIIACHHEPDVYSYINKPSEKLITLFKRSADGIDSGVDKGAVSDTNKQTINHTYISTPFGYEFEKININSKQLKQYRDKFIQKIETILDQIQRLLSEHEDKNISAEEWLHPRDKLLECAKDCFTHALGETRRSANDVTLWDHSYSTASLYKSALAEVVISGQWKDPSGLKWRLLSVRFNGFNYIMKSNKIGDILGRKKRLELALDLIRYLLEVYVPIGNEIYRDENGSVFLIPESIDKNALNEWMISNSTIKLVVKGEKIVKDPKEITKIVAEVIAGDLRLDDTIVVFINSTDTIKSAIERIFNEITYGELKPIIKVSEKSSRGAVNLGKMLEENKVLFNQPFVSEVKKEWNYTKAPICKVCGLKPCKKREDGGYYDLCNDCMKIREKRAKVWCDEERIKYKSTIWIDEICDKNRRVGIVVGAFDLSNWLNGMWLNTCFTKVLDDLKKSNPDIFNQVCNFETLIKVVKEAIDKNDPNAELSIKKTDKTHVKVRELLKALGGDSYRGQKAQEYFDAIIKEREADVVGWAYYNEQINIDDLPNEEKAKLLILALFRKNPSFARIRRIWETTKRFWDDIEGLIKKELDIRIRYKILIYRKLNELKENNAYELRVEGLRIPIFCSKVEDNKTELIIIENLGDLGIDLKQLKSRLESYKFEIWEDSDYAKRARKLYPSKDSKDIGKLRVEIEKDFEYIPYISILKEPTLFIAMLPLNKCWNIIKLIKKEYEIQFSKVQNRLPIKIGLIAFKRKYPLYVVMDAVKRLISEEIEEKVFEVKRIERLSAEENCKRFDGRLGNYASVVEVEGKNRRFKFYMSYSLGDPNLEDIFYPYFIIIETKNECVDLDMLTWLYNQYIEKFNTCLNVKKEMLLRHVSKLKDEDIILFEPSIFDFEFLDSNIRRFDIGKKRKHWLFADSINKPKPYLLWDIDNFERLRKLIQKLGLTTTQIMNLYEMLMAKLEEWEIRKPPVELKNSKNEKDKEKAEVFEKLVENAIKDIPLRLEVIDGESDKGKISKEDFEFLKDSIMSGLFFDFVDLWHTILKLDFKENNSGGGESESI
jgi:CRISPR-associated Csx11 family protein